MQIKGRNAKEMSAATVEECWDLCVNDTSCVAIDYSTVEVEAKKNCQFYNTHGDELVAATDVVHYRMVNCTGCTT